MGEATGTIGGAGVGTLGIAGIGLIGGSVAAAAKLRGLSQKIIGFGRSPDRMRAAQTAGLIDDWSLDYGVCESVDLFISCLPVDRIVESLRLAAAHMRPGAVLTDAGSIKLAICQAFGAETAPGVTFVGSHPIAGSEKQGFEYADANLFVDRTCVITPARDASAKAVERVTAFWQALGSRVVMLSPAAHDSILSRTSHLPHVVAAAVAGSLGEDEGRMAAGGFRDTTRIASGDPDLWTGILMGNRDALVTTLGDFIERCQRFRQAIATGDTETLRHLLTDAKTRRDAFGRGSEPH